MAWFPPEIDIDSENFRYLSFLHNTEEIKSLDIGLIMSGNTPLSLRIPRRSNMSIDYMNGSIDLSWQTGEMHFDNRTIEYAFSAYVKFEPEDTLDTMNSKCKNKLTEITAWATHADDDKMFDSGAGIYQKVQMIGLEVDKVYSPAFWTLSISLKFEVYPFLYSLYEYPEYITPSTPINTGTPIKGRRFSFGSGHSYTDYGLFITSDTPLAPPPIKYRSLDLPFADGNANRGYFYGDTVIKYTCSFFLKNEGTRNSMNRKCQSAVECICDWLYGVSDISEHEGIRMKGTATLFDSSLGEFYLARCTGITVNKMLFDEFWILVYQIEFTTYPKIDI